MNKDYLNEQKWVIVLLLLLAVLAIVWYPQLSSYFGEKTKPRAADNQQPMNDKSLILPLPPTSPGVSGITLTYHFVGELHKIEKIAEGHRLTLAPGKDLQQTLTFVLTENSSIYFISNDGQRREGLISDLREGMNVTTLAPYDVQKKQWGPVDVFIQPL